MSCGREGRSWEERKKRRLILSHALCTSRQLQLGLELAIWITADWASFSSCLDMQTKISKLQLRTRIGGPERVYFIVEWNLNFLKHGCLFSIWMGFLNLLLVHLIWKYVLIMGRAFLCCILYGNCIEKLCGTEGKCREGGNLYPLWPLPCFINPCQHPTFLSSCPGCCRCPSKVLLSHLAWGQCDAQTRQCLFTQLIFF